MPQIWIAATIGFAMPFVSGFLGLMTLDQSIIFEAGARISKGETAFTDFYMAYGFVPALMQAFFFKLFGISWFTYVLHAALVNGLFAATAYYALRLILPAGYNKQAFAGALLAAWGFYPMIGTPFMDNHSFFFGFVAYWSALAAFKREKYLLWLLCFPCLVLGFYSKPLPVIFWIFPVLLECWLNRNVFVSHLKWILLSIALALVIALLPFLFLSAYHFFYYTFQLPFRLATHRIGLDNEQISGEVGGERYKLWLTLLMVTLIFFVFSINRQHRILRFAYYRASVMMLATVVAGVITINTFFASVAPVLPIVFIIYASLDLSHFRPARMSKIARLSLGVIWIALIVAISWYNLSRKANEMIFRPSDLQYYSPELGLFLKTAGDTHSVNDIKQLYKLMKDENCLYVGDMMMLYSITHKKNPWPVTHLHDNTSYYSGDSIEYTALKKQLVENMLRNNTSTLIHDNLLWGEEDLVVFVNTLKGRKKNSIGTIIVYEIDKVALERMVSSLKISLDK